MECSSPRAKHRAQVTPGKRGKRNKPPSDLGTEEQTPTERRASMTWAQRLKRVFNIDVEICRECGGPVWIIACIEDPVVIKKTLTHLDEQVASTQAPRLPRCRAPPQAGMFD